MNGVLPRRHNRKPGIARRAGLHRYQDIDLLLKDQGVEGLLGAGGAGSVVRDFEGKFLAEQAAGGIDFIDGQFRGLHHGRGDNAVGAAQPDRNTDRDALRARSAATGQR